MNPHSRKSDKNYRFHLDKSPKKYICPQCGKKRFVRYVESATGELCDDETSGRCDREQHCQYHKYPESDSVPLMQEVKPKPIVDIPRYVLEATLERTDNPFRTWLKKYFNSDSVDEVLRMYLIGTAGPWLTIPFINEKNKIRAIQCKKFDAEGHTIKPHGTNSIVPVLSKGVGKIWPWMRLYQEQDLKISCLFGAHLLKRYPHSPIGLVESPKTAIICTLKYGMPGTLWMATYNKSSFTEDRVRILKGRKVTVIPDLGAFDDWKAKCDQFGFGISDYIEKIATSIEREQGLDIGDFIIKKLELIH